MGWWDDLTSDVGNGAGSGVSADASSTFNPAADSQAYYDSAGITAPDYSSSYGMPDAASITSVVPAGWETATVGDGSSSPSALFNGVDLNSYTGGGAQQPSALASLNADGTFNAARDSQAANTAANAGPLTKTGSLWSAIAKGLGVADKQGNVDLSNPATLSKLLKIGVSGAGALNALLGGSKPQGYQSVAQLQAQLASPYSSWTPAQQAIANAYFNTRPSVGLNRQTLAAAALPTSLVPTTARPYAGGGPVGSPGNPVDGSGDLVGSDAPGDLGAPMYGIDNPFYARGGPLTLVRGPGGGQDDQVHARLSPGEYVWDADTVSALGDGSNEHGARLLDELRENVRRHKRAAPATSIPPKAREPARYLPSGALRQRAREAGRG